VDEEYRPISRGAFYGQLRNQEAQMMLRMILTPDTDPRHCLSR
jgi:hypothetical protein